ncbi:hypothetical protein ACFY2M_43235 [Streptomyces sp. NPDC001276]|uniref:hypothetical protein n=1 Tax=Streptomyces sp. NPDC001276 TaxID=3364555 RepID=UPI0036A8DC24
MQSQQFVSFTSLTFYLRVEFAHADGTALDLDAPRRKVRLVAGVFDMTWQLTDGLRRPRAVIVGRHLRRHRFGLLTDPARSWSSDIAWCGRVDLAVRTWQ